MAAARRRYFRRHRSAKARSAFVRGQRRRLTALSRAVSGCRVPATASPAPEADPEADLMVATNGAPMQLAAGEMATETFTVTNRGPAHASAVSIHLSVSSSSVELQSPVASSGTCGSPRTDFSCSLGGLDAGGAITVTVVLRASLVGTSTATASVDSLQPDPHSADNAAAATVTVVAPTPTFHAPATFVVGSGVTPDAQAFVRYSLDVAATFFKTSLGVDASPLTAYVYADLDELVQKYAIVEGVSVDAARHFWQTTGGGVTATAWNSRIWLFLGSPDWAGAPEWARTKIAVHEMFHLVQEHLAGPSANSSDASKVPPVGAVWLLEGSAEYVGYRAVAANGLHSMTDAVEGWKWATKQTPEPLQTMETYNGLFAARYAYSVAPLAVDALVGTSALQALAGYYASIGHTAPWQSAFATSFGRPLAEFYAAFAAYRGGL